MKHENGLFIFRRDLRIVDNKGLYLAASKCKNLYCVFIFTPEQVGPSNKYKSDNSVLFMIESLEDLNKSMNGSLLTFYGHNNAIVKQLIERINIDYVCFNADYTPYAIERDLNIIKMCELLCVECEHAFDYYLHAPGTFKPYQKFTPYYNVASSKHVDQIDRTRSLPIRKFGGQLFDKISLNDAFRRFTKENGALAVRGGRAEGVKMLNSAHKSQKHYSTTHNDLAKSTSMFSAYIKFGCVSIREVYYKMKSNHAFTRQLFWRDFYAQVLFYFPKVLGHALKDQYDKIYWHHNASWFDKWKNGETGFPIVDAGMRQMNATGYMHNRARLIVSSFLIKTLLIDWRKGEQYFAQTLVDYDVASNNGNWQWSAGSGADAQPYFRVFNPWRQAEEHDPDCTYVKKWIPELENVLDKDILTWNESYSKYKDIKYPKPICDYTEQKEKALKMYKDGLY